MNRLGVGLLGAAKGGSEEYLNIREEERAEERKIAGEERATEGAIAKEGRAQDIWELRQKRLDDFGIAGEERKEGRAIAGESRRSGLIEGRETAKEGRKTKREEREAGRIRGAMEESRPRTEAAPDEEGESIGPPQIGAVDEEAAAGLLTQKGYPGLAKDVRESKGGATGSGDPADMKMAKVYMDERGMSRADALDYVRTQKRSDPEKLAMDWARMRQKEQLDMGVPEGQKELTAKELLNEGREMFGGKGDAPAARRSEKSKPPVENAFRARDKDGNISWWVKKDGRTFKVEE